MHEKLTKTSAHKLITNSPSGTKFTIMLERRVTERRDDEQRNRRSYNIPMNEIPSNFGRRNDEVNRRTQ